jgi:hypothetical protein
MKNFGSLPLGSSALPLNLLVDILSQPNLREGILAQPVFGKKKPAQPAPEVATDDEAAMMKLRDDVAQLVSQFQQSTGRKINCAFVAFDKDASVGCAYASAAVLSWSIIRDMFNELESNSTLSAIDDIIRQVR